MAHVVVKGACKFQVFFLGELSNSAIFYSSLLLVYMTQIIILLMPSFSVIFPTLHCLIRFQPSPLTPQYKFQNTHLNCNHITLKILRWN